MQFKLQVCPPLVDVSRIEEVILAVDPAALVDLDGPGTHVRVSSSIAANELCDLFAQAGCPVARSQLIDVPSECCGGCGG